MLTTILFIILLLVFGWWILKALLLIMLLPLQILFGLFGLLTGIDFSNGNPFDDW